jgi:hypothetical protein
VEQAEFRHVGQVERPFAQSRFVGFPGVGAFQYVANRIRTGVAECFGIPGAADADGVEDEEKSAFHVNGPLFYLRALRYDRASPALTGW